MQVLHVLAFLSLMLNQLILQLMVKMALMVTLSQLQQNYGRVMIKRMLPLVIKKQKKTGEIFGIRNTII